MSDLLPGQKIQRLVTEAVRDAYDKGREFERERIIKLLGQDVCPDWTVMCCDVAFSANKRAIALIKGEQK